MSRYEIVWQILTLHCDGASRLSSESLDHELAPGDKLAWQFHLLLCRSCRRHRRQIAELRRTSQAASELVERPQAPLPEEIRERIKRSMKNGGSAG